VGRVWQFLLDRAGVRSGGELGDCLGDELVPVWDPDDAGSGWREREWPSWSSEWDVGLG